MSSPTLSTLIRHSLPQLDEDTLRDKQHFAQYVLDSTIGTTGPSGTRSREWTSLVDEANRLVFKRAGGSSQSALHFAHLSSRLRTQAIPRDKAQTLSFLLSLANSSEASTSPSAPAAMPSSSASSSSRPASLFPHPTLLEGSRSSAAQRASTPSAIGTSQDPPSTSTSAATPVALPRAPRLSMAATLAQHRARQTASGRLPPVPESLLVRDILYIIQGVDGQFIRFKPRPPRREGPRRTFKRGEIVVDEQEPGPEELLLEDGIEFVLDRSGWSLSAPTRVLLHTISELGWLYRKINEAIQKGSDHHHAAATKVGMIEQSLHAALQGEMTEYYRLVAILEGQWVGEGNEREPEDSHGGIEEMEGKLTLRRLMVWTDEVKLRMRMMGTLVEETGGDNVGGALLTSLHARTSNGDPFIRDFSARLLRTLSVPFFATLSAWIYEGELHDPFGEFFVEINPALGDAGRRQVLGEIATLSLGDDDEGVQAHQLWEGKFRFKKGMLPGFLEESFGRKIFSTGKSLNFMKYSCGDGQWVASRHQIDGAQRNLEYADIIGLEQSIAAAYSHTSKHLFDIFFDKFHLMDHLKALKDYLMLGKGDFVEILMESLGPSLERPANLLYRHNLTATLESALRGSTSASYSATSGAAKTDEVIRRLDARMLEFTQGEIGWDVFTLEYKVDAPLDTILDPESMQGYLKMFKHLWQIKRVEYALNGVQRRLMTGARTFLKVPDLAYDFHRTRIALQRMTFFIRQLQYYCHLEVIACSWQVLEEFALKKQGDLDSLIEAHRVYLDRLVTKALLIQPKKKDDRFGMLEGVRSLFRVMLQYQNVADALCNYALSEASRLHPTNPTAAARSADALDGIRQRLDEYSAQFDVGAKSLVALLGKAKDLDMRFLAVRLNFNYKFS